MNLLVISTVKASSDSANGKTILNVARCFPNPCVSNLYTQHSSLPNETDVTYFEQTDQMVIRALLGKKTSPDQSPSPNSETQPSRRRVKGAFPRLIRSILWSISPWKHPYFDAWVEAINPDAILVYVGDSVPLLSLGMSISNDRHIPLYLFTGENYCFKEFDYFHRTLKQGPFYRMFHKALFSACKKAYSQSSLALFNSPELAKEYCSHFLIGNSCVIYPPSNSIPQKKPYVAYPLKRVVYGGNIYLGRHKGIIEIADCLKRYFPDAVLDVYGTGDDAAISELSAVSNIRVHSPVPNEELVRIIESADLLIHTESFDPYFVEDLKFAFSTKIVESLMSGTPFLIYGPANAAGLEYCRRVKGAFVVNSKAELKQLFVVFSRGEAPYGLDVDSLIRTHSFESNRTRIESHLCNLT